MECVPFDLARPGEIVGRSQVFLNATLRFRRLSRLNRISPRRPRGHKVCAEKFILGWIMKAATIAFYLCAMFSNSICSPQSTDFYSSPSYSQLKDDYNQVSVVARVLVDDTVPLNGGDQYYYEFIARGKVIEAFKGGFRTGQPIEFYVRAEQGYDHKAQRGNWIFFLNRRLDQQTRKLSYHELENSMHPPSKAIVAKLRRLKREHLR